MLRLFGNMYVFTKKLYRIKPTLTNGRFWYLSLINSDPVCVCKPLVLFDVSNAILQIAKTFRQVDLQLVAKEVLYLSTEVRRKPHLNYKFIIINVLIIHANSHNNITITLYVLDFLWCFDTARWNGIWSAKTCSD